VQSLAVQASSLRFPGQAGSLHHKSAIDQPAEARMSESATDEDRIGKESPYGTPPNLQFTLRGLVQFSVGATVCLSLATTAARSESEWVSVGCGVSSALAAWVVLLITYRRLNASSALATHILMAVLVWLFALAAVVGSIGQMAGVGEMLLFVIFFPLYGACLLACAFSLPMLAVTTLMALYRGARDRRQEKRRHGAESG
jgi:hypothetical protein